MTNVNFKDNTLFCSFVETKNNIPFCLLYRSNLDGSNMQYLTRVQMSDVNTTLNLISVFDDYLYVSFPYSGIDGNFIKIE